MSMKIAQEDGSELEVFTQDELDAAIKEATSKALAPEVLRPHLDKAAAAARKEADRKIQELEGKLQAQAGDGDALTLIQRQMQELTQKMTEEQQLRQQAERRMKETQLLATLGEHGLRKGATKLASRVLADYLAEGDADLSSEEAIKDLVERVRTDHALLFEEEQAPEQKTGGLTRQRRQDAPPEKSMNDLIRGR